ncbi:MAG: hypothetical protein COZ56_21115, partial [Armatimonadetes bacterium CG_4_8_14_3_um_filter_58_9]
RAKICLLFCVLRDLCGEGMRTEFMTIYLEAMACGVPVVATDCSAVTELVQDRGELIRVKDWLTVGPYNVDMAIADVDHLVELLEKLYRNSDLRAEYGRKGREFAETMTWDRCAERWAQLLDEVAGEAPIRHRRTRSVDKDTVVIQRRNSIGDVIAASFVATRLKQHDPNRKVVLAANPGPCSELLLHHPDIDELIAPDQQPADVLLDGCYENHPAFHSEHIYHFFLKTAGIIDVRNVLPRIHLLPEELQEAEQTLNQYSRPWIMVGLRSRYAPERSVPDEKWEEFAELMRGLTESGGLKESEGEGTLFGCGGPQETSVKGMVDFAGKSLSVSMPLSFRSPTSW